MYLQVMSILYMSIWVGYCKSCKFTNDFTLSIFTDQTQSVKYNFGNF